ncbi:MAG: HD domain-containing protein [Desulforhopalus sp.]
MNSAADNRSPLLRCERGRHSIPSPRIPTINQCLEYIEQFEMLDNIRDHSFVVARVAETLVDGLQRTGKSTGPLPARDEVIAGALLHDIAKTICLKTDCLHAEAGRDICIQLGYPEVGEIVAEHVVLKNFADNLYRQGIFGAKEVVFYADKRVRHDQVVSLDGRLEYILERYGRGDPDREDRIRLNFHKTLELEKFLFAFLDFSPKEITQRMSHRQFLPAG